MPAVIDCPTCGPQSLHGFSGGFLGTLHLYGLPGCNIYRVGGRDFPTAISAFDFALALPGNALARADTAWIAAARAQLGGATERRVKALWRAWRAVSDRGPAPSR